MTIISKPDCNVSGVLPQTLSGNIILVIFTVIIWEPCFRVW